MRTTIAIILIGLLSQFIQAQELDKVSIDNVFKEWDSPDTPGCALGIIQNGELVYGRGYGMANLEYDIPINTKSVFRIGSTSKQFTAACIVLLEEQGKLKFDDKLSKFFPAFPDYADDITVLHLLNHSSGIRDYLAIAYLAGLGSDDFYTDEDVMNWLVNQQENNFAPNEEFLYSNSGYWLLGQIVKKVSGQNMAEFAKKEIFEPLGMVNTHFHNDHTMVVPNRASGYRPGAGGYKISMTTLDMIGDGGIFSTIEDLKIWDDHYYNSDVLSKEFWNTMSVPLTLNDGSKEDYGKGIFNGEYKGLTTLSHGGAFVGFRAEMIRFPSEETTIIVLANRADANPTGKAYQVADIILKEKLKAQEQGESKAMDEGPKAIKLPKKQLEKFCSSYWNSSGNYSRKIYLKGDTLRYARSERNESSLVPIGKSEFKMLGVNVDLRVHFSENKDGIKTMTVIIDGGDPIEAMAYEPVTYSEDEFKKFAGSYYSDELNVRYDLKMVDAELVLFVNDEKISSMSSIKANLLSNDRYGLFDFSDGDITTFKLMAGRVKNLQFVRK